VKDDIKNDNQIVCPVAYGDIGPLAPFDELLPLLEHLQANTEVSEASHFPRGSVWPDGRLDCCKQALGSSGVKHVADALLGNSNIRSVLLGTNGMGDDGAIALSEVARDRPNIEIWYLGCNRIGPEGVRKLADSLRETTINGLWLKRNPIGDQGIEAVAQLLRNHPTLRTLDLVNVGMTMQSLPLLVDACSQAQALSRIYLGGNNLGLESAELLVQLMKLTPNLKALHLNASKLGDDGTIHLADHLPDTIEELSLASNGLTSRGAVALAKVLANHPNMKSLSVGNCASAKPLNAPLNQLGEEGGNALAKMLTTNRVLKLLDVSRRALDSVCRQAFTDALNQNDVLDELRWEGPRLRSRPHKVYNEDTSLIRSVGRKVKQ
jgi:hypothetical protein